jgi:hypothetical protein
LKTTISIDGPNDVNNYRVYTIKGKANVTIGTISFPIYDFTDTKINTLSFDTSTKKLTITDTTGSTFETTVPYKDYVQGDGININGSTVSVKYDGTTIVKDAATGNLKSVFSIANDAPIIVSNGNTVGLNYNSSQFEVSEGALSIKDGVIPDLSNLESTVTTIQGNITTMNTALANKANIADLSDKLDVAQPNVTVGYYPVVRVVNGEKRIVFEEFPILDEDIEKLQKLDTLVLSGWKLHDLCNWVLNLKKGEWDSSEFFSSEDSLVLECNCHNEILVTYYDYESDIIYFEIFDNYWLKRKYRKKITSEFSICREDAQKSFKLLLNFFK